MNPLETLAHAYVHVYHDKDALEVLQNAAGTMGFRFVTTPDWIRETVPVPKMLYTIAVKDLREAANHQE